MSTPSGNGSTPKRETTNIATRRERLSGIAVSAGVKSKAASPHTGMQVYDRPELDTEQFIKIKNVITSKNSSSKTINTVIYIIIFILVLAVAAAIAYYLL